MNCQDCPNIPKDWENLEQKILGPLADIEVYGIGGITADVGWWILWLLALGSNDTMGLHDTTDLIVFGISWAIWSALYISSGVAKRIRTLLD